MSATIINSNINTNLSIDSCVDMWYSLGNKLKLKFAEISLEEITSEADLDRIVCEKDAVIQSCFSYTSYKLDGPVTYRAVISIFDKMLCEINGETNHIFLEKIKVVSPTEEGNPYRIMFGTGS